MAKQIINVGAAANDGTGDPIRTAMVKTNTNFDELYTDVAALDVAVTALSGGGGGSSLQSRTAKAGTTASIANGASADLSITGFKTYALLSITTDRAAWVRIYANGATRTADASRLETSDPAPDAGVIAEVITTGAQTVLVSPGVIGYNLESTPTTVIPCRVTNKSGATSTVVVTLNILQLEA